jgi:probable HAF family extracellular repeat protein
MSRCWPMTVMLTFLIGLALVAAPPVPGANLPSTPGYLITDLGSLGGGQTVPVAINAKGDVAGYSTTSAGEIHAFLLPANGVMQDLGTAGAASYVTGMNNAGDVVGYSIAGGQTRPLVRVGGQVIDLGLAGTGALKAVGINDLRQVLVVQDAGEGNVITLIWQNGPPTAVPALDGRPTEGTALNNLGQVVGTATGGGKTRVFAFDPSLPEGSLRRLLDLGDITPIGKLPADKTIRGMMTSLNDLGQATGVRIIPTGDLGAFGADLTRDSDFLADKALTPPYDSSLVFSINNENIAVGAGVLAAAPGSEAGYWTSDLDYEFPKLNEIALPPNSGWVLLDARAINDAGVIVGRALGPDGQTIGYILTTLKVVLATEKAAAIAASLDPAIVAIRTGVEASTKADTPTALATALIDLEQARSLLTPAAGETSVSGINTGRAAHLLISAGKLLTFSDSSKLLPVSDRDTALMIIEEARKGLQ